MGQDVRSAGMKHGRFPGVVLAVGKDRPFKSLADLESHRERWGFEPRDSPAYLFVLPLMARAGLAPGDASFVGVGGGAAASAR